jgi:transcription elongation factor Elf1
VKKEYLGESRDMRINRWRITCDFGKGFEPLTTMVSTQVVVCPKCGKEELVNYNLDAARRRRQRDRQTGYPLKKLFKKLRQLFCSHVPYPFRALNDHYGLVCEKCGKNYERKQADKRKRRF